VRTLVHFSLSSGAALGLLAGCGGTAPPIGAPGAMPQSRAIGTHANRHETWMLQDVAPSEAKHYLYAVDPKNSEVHVYPLAGKHQREIAHIDHLPAAFGIATDRAGNLYVSVSARAEVSVYAPMTKEPFLTLKDRVGTDFPWGVAVSGTGDVAVANNISFQPYRPSHVSFFHAGATRPYATFTNGTSFAECIWDAYDDAGDLYVTGQSADGHATLGEIVSGGNGRKLRDLHATGLSRSAGGIEVDAAGDVVVAQAARLSVFAPHSNRLLRTIHYGRGVNASKGLVLTPTRADFYLANDKLNPAQLWEYRYPAGGNPINKIDVIPQGHPRVVEVSGLAIGPLGAP
jgi:DNA-binding beta-propeller fold protein YncE